MANNMGGERGGHHGCWRHGASQMAIFVLARVSGGSARHQQQSIEAEGLILKIWHLATFLLWYIVHSAWYQAVGAVRHKQVNRHSCRLVLGAAYG